VRIDEGKNGAVRRGETADVSAERSAARVLVIPTDEEREIALQTLGLVEAGEAGRG
jgi:acetate kinase